MGWVVRTGADESPPCFRGKMGVVRTLRRDETIISNEEEEKDFNGTLLCTQTLGRKAWRVSDEEKRLFIMSTVDDLNKGLTTSVWTLEELERKFEKFGV